MEDQNKNTWLEWSRYILKELESLNADVEKLRNCDHAKDIEIAMLKERVTRSAFLWGVIGALIPITVGLIIYFLTKGGQ